MNTFNPTTPTSPEPMPVQPVPPPAPQAPPVTSQAQPASFGFPGGGFAPQSTPPVNVYSPAAPPTKKGVSKGLVLVGILVLLLAGGIIGLSRVGQFSLLSSAAGACEPEGLKEDSLNANSVEVTFQTSQACQFTIAYGICSGSDKTEQCQEKLLLETIPEAMKALNHRIRLSPLLPGTTYYYLLKSDSKPVGTLHSFLTKVAEAAPEENPAAEIPVSQPVVTQPTSVPKTSTPSAKTTGGAAQYTETDFSALYGLSSKDTGFDAKFDINKDKIINSFDWKAYQQSLQ